MASPNITLSKSSPPATATAAKDDDLENGYLSDSSSSASEDCLNVDEDDGGISLRFQPGELTSRRSAAVCT